MMSSVGLQLLEGVFWGGGCASQFYRLEGTLGNGDQVSKRPSPRIPRPKRAIITRSAGPTTLGSLLLFRVQF